MEQKILYEREAKCVQENLPGCTAGCPVHVDARGMIAAVRKGDYAAGFALFRRMVPFPGIISRVCDHPCQETCTRKGIDESILIHAFEKVCVDNNHNPAPPLLAPPLKNKRVAITGAGLSGLTAALALTQKGYQVTVFEATDHLGGSIRDIPESLLPLEVTENDLAIFSKLSLEIQYNVTVGNGNGSTISFDLLCTDFDAIFLGVGCQAVNSPGLDLDRDVGGKLVIDPLTLATSHPKVFAGGSLRRDGKDYSPIASISDGRIAAISIDRLLQNASLTANREKEGPFVTTLYTNVENVSPQPMTLMGDPAAGYSKEEAVREAGRCLQCECRECVKECEYLTHYGSYPRRYVREIYNNLSIVKGFRSSNKMINSCSLCGLCGEICPQQLSMGEVCREARQLMVKQGKMPPSAHDFALRDMKFSNSKQFALSRHQPGFTSSSTVFFPGCQLAASAPQYIKQIYQFLGQKMDGGVGLMLGCCGAPADWAGQEEVFQETLQNIERNWRDLGSPKVITACPSCFSMFSQNLPEMPIEMLWTLLDRIGLPDHTGLGVTPQKLAIHDSCTTRHEAQLHNSVRNILGKLGHAVEELPRSREKTICCGYGGLMIYANREVAKKEIKRRIQERPDDYLTYCSMCRDNFAGQGKRVYHLLDLIWESGAERLAEHKGPGYSQRQENRARLKRSLLREIWGDTVAEPQDEVKVLIPEDIKQVMEERMILVADVIQVITHAESSGDKMQNTENSHYIACFKPASVTYWVEYSPQDDGFSLHNAYCHRMEITG
jgi:glutamate synthase (NADPH) small chain